MSQSISYKTNIKCNGCIAAVTPHFEKSKIIKTWQVDLESPDRILTVELDGGSPEEVKAIVNQAGYHAEEVKR